MPPICIKKFSNEIIKDITRGNNVHMLYHIHRRQEDFSNNHKVNPTPVSSIPTIALPHGPVSLTLVTTSTIIDSGSIPTPTDIGATDIDTATPIATDISATDTETAAIPTDTSAPEIPKIPKIPFPSIPPSITTPITTVTPLQTQNPITSPFSIFSSTSPTTTTTSSSTSSSSPSPPSSGPSNNTKSNNLHVWMFSILAILILIIILAVLALIYRKRKRKENTLHDTNAGDITDKDKENSSKTNSLTSSINSISSSLKMKKGKIVPVDINVGSPPVPNILNNNKDDEEKPEKPHMPILKRTPTTVSAFQELVDLTDDEHFNLRQSTSSGIYTIASRLSSTPTYVNYDAEEGSSSNVINVIPLQQERIDTIIPRSSTDGSGGLLTRTFTSINPFDTSNNNNQ